MLTILNPCVQWNPYNQDTLGSKCSVLISKVSVFQGFVYCMLEYNNKELVPKAGVLIGTVSLFQRFGIEGFHCRMFIFILLVLYIYECMYVRTYVYQIYTPGSALDV